MNKTVWLSLTLFAVCPLIGAQKAYYDDAYSIRQYEFFTRKAEKYCGLVDNVSKKKLEKINKARQECWDALSIQGQIIVSKKRHDVLTNEMMASMQRGDAQTTNIYRARLERSRQSIADLHQLLMQPRRLIQEQKDIII